MDLLYKTAAAMLLASLMALLIRKTNPELALLINLMAVTLAFFAAGSYAFGIRDLSDTVKTMMHGKGNYVDPILKCVAVSFVTRISSDLCKDSAQSASASALEVLGTVCAMGIAMPLILNVLMTIGGLL